MLKQYEHEQALKIQGEQNEASLLNTCVQLGFDFYPVIYNQLIS